MRFFYTLGICLYYAVIYCISPFHPKAKLWIKGRKRLFPALKSACQNKKIVWVHCASLGEYEQGRPLIDKIKREHPELSVLCTFFSPSGYEIKKNDTLLDLVFYFPVDTIHNSKKFIDIVRPQAAIFIKYEYWYNYMNQLHQNNIPFYYVSAIYRKDQPFFRWYGRWFRHQLTKCTYIYLQNQASKELLNAIGIDNCEVIGDTRFDRVYQTSLEPISLDFVTHFKANKKAIICGSTWPEDEQILCDAISLFKQKFKWIIAPHLIDKEHIDEIKSKFSSYKTICYSEIQAQNLAEYDICIIDTIGLLRKLYYFGEYAFIGGAFKTGLHNIIEASVFGIPVFFGPHYKKFNEANELVSLETAFPIENAKQFVQKIDDLELNQEKYFLIRQKTKKYIVNNLGAVNKIKLVLSS